MHNLRLAIFRVDEKLYLCRWSQIIRAKKSMKRCLPKEFQCKLPYIISTIKKLFFWSDRYGQMTAGSYCYIGPQGIVHGTTVSGLTLNCTSCVREGIRPCDVCGVAHLVHNDYPRISKPTDQRKFGTENAALWCFKVNVAVLKN